MGTLIAPSVASVWAGSNVPELKMPNALILGSWFCAYACVPPQLMPAAAIFDPSMLANSPWPAFCSTQSIAAVICWSVVDP